MTPKDWNTQEEAIAAAKAEILAAIGDTDARLELGMVKSVQRGFIEPNSVSGWGEQKITIAPVNMEKSVVICSGDGNYSNSNYSSITQMASYARLTSSTELSYKLSFKSSNSSTWIPNPLVWQVVEFY